MLIKIGDVWIDPLAVEALEWVPEVVATAPAVRASSGTPTWSGISEWLPGRAGEPAYVLVTTPDSEVRAHGVTLDEAAQAINRCREQHMGRR